MQDGTLGNCTAVKLLCLELNAPDPEAQKLVVDQVGGSLLYTEAGVGGEPGQDKQGYYGWVSVGQYLQVKAQMTGAEVDSVFLRTSYDSSPFGEAVEDAGLP